MMPTPEISKENTIKPIKLGSNPSAKKWIMTGGVLLAIFAALVVFKVVSITMAIQKGKSFVMPPEAITTTVVVEEKWQDTLAGIGTLQAVNGVNLTADLAGVVSGIFFESGAQAKKGELLVQQDIGQEQAQLRAAESRQQLALLNVNRFKGLLDKRVSSQSDYDKFSAEYLEAQAASDEIRATIARKTIRAPFDGVLGIRQVNVGQYLKPGDMVVPLQSLDPIYVNFSLPQQFLTKLAVGQTVRVKAAGAEGTHEGKVTAINAIVDQATRNVQVQATLSNASSTLRAGMFASVEVVLPEEKTVLAIPITSINYAPYGDSIYVVEEKKDDKGESHLSVRQQFVKLGASRGDRVEVTSGLKIGDQVASSGIFKLRPDAAVSIENDIKPSNELKPTPEES